MSLKLVSYNPGSCLRCGGADGPEIDTGESVKIYLNQDRNENFSEYITGIVTAVDQASVTDTTRTYTVQYESEDLPDGILELAACDISSLICESCCDILQERINDWEDADEPAVSLSYYWNDDGLVVLYANAYSRVPGVTITAYGWADVGANEAITPSGEVTDNNTIVPDSDATDFAGGLYNVTVTDSAGHVSEANVYVDPTKVKFRIATAVLADTASTVAVSLNAGEYITNAIITTAGAGVLIESITQSGTTATITFTATNATGSAVNLRLTIARNLP